MIFARARHWLIKLLVLCRKEGKQIVRDPSSWLVAVVLPMIYLFLLGFGISMDADQMRVAIINESGGYYSTDLSLSFSNSPQFEIIASNGREAAGAMMQDSKIQGFIVIPNNFDSLVSAAKPSQVQVIVDGSAPNSANFIQAAAQGVINSWNLARLANSGVLQNQPLRLEPVFWYNNTAKSRWNMVPGAVTIVMTLIGTLLTSLVITREWERGTMEALFASPVTRMQIFLSKLLPYYVLAIVSTALCWLATVHIFQVPFRGSLGALYLLSTAFLIPSLGQGLLVSSLFRSQLPAVIVGFLSGLLPSFILSGLLFDIHSMPIVIQYITYLIPARYFNVSLQTLYLAGDVWPVFAVSMAYMLVLGLFFFVLVYRNLSKRLD